MTTKNLNTVTNFIKTASLEGLETVMVALMRAGENLTPVQQAAIQSVINQDDVTKAAARLSAASPTGIEGYETIKPLLANATFEEVKKYIHAVDTRLKSLPETQRNQVFATINPDPLADLLASMGLPADGQYFGDDDNGDVEDTETV